MKRTSIHGRVHDLDKMRTENETEYELGAEKAPFSKVSVTWQTRQEGRFVLRNWLVKFGAVPPKCLHGEYVTPFRLPNISKIYIAIRIHRSREKHSRKVTSSQWVSIRDWVQSQDSQICIFVD